VVSLNLQLEKSLVEDQNVNIKEESKVDAPNLKRSPSKSFEAHKDNFIENSIPSKINFNDNYSGYKNLNNHSMMECQRDNKLELLPDSRRSYDILNQDSFITKETISKFENNVSREKRNSTNIIKLVHLLYQIRNKISLKTTVFIVIVVVLGLLLLLIKAKI
jgi:hypothetical protein